MTSNISWQTVGAVAVVLFVMTALGLLVGASAATAQENSSCTTVVEHDAFMEDEEAINALANGSTVRSTERNTRVTLGKNNTFYQIDGRNPNSYCVHFVVKVDSEAMPSTQLPAKIQSNDGKHEASWDAVHNFSGGETYTQIEFSLPANTDASWSPNEIRIASIAWASERRDTAETLFGRLQKRLSSEDDVAQRKYDIEAEAAGEQVTIPLENPQTGEDVDEWTARYTTDDGYTWHKLGTSAEESVFYNEDENGESIRLTFNDPDARVKFIADPTPRDEFGEQVTMWYSGVKEIGSRMPWN